MIFVVLRISSLVFISAFEAAQVFVLYAASAIVRQIFVQIELSSMRQELSSGAIVGNKNTATGPGLQITEHK